MEIYLKQSQKNQLMIKVQLLIGPIYGCNETRYSNQYEKWLPWCMPEYSSLDLYVSPYHFYRFLFNSWLLPSFPMDPVSQECLETKFNYHTCLW